MTDKERALLIEILADFEHESWSRWMKWLFSAENGVWDDDGYLIRYSVADRWRTLVETPYPKMDEPTKQYDRDEVAHIMPIIELVLSLVSHR